MFCVREGQIGQSDFHAVDRIYRSFFRVGEGVPAETWGWNSFQPVTNMTSSSTRPAAEILVIVRSQQVLFFEAVVMCVDVLVWCGCTAYDTGVSVA